MTQVTECLRVDDLDAVLNKLRAGEAGIDPAGGSRLRRFAWFHDLEGNRVELWEPPKTLPA